MNKIEKGKRSLIGLSIGAIILGLLFLGGGVALIVNASLTLLTAAIYLTVIKFVFGVILIILGGIALVYGITFVWTGSALVATKGSVAEENLGKGTANMVKCKNCGSEVQKGNAFCGNCGKSLSEKTVCPKCGATNMDGTKKCTACGEEIEK